MEDSLLPLISYERGRFFSVAGILSPERGAYLSSYLRQISHYRIIGFHEASPVFSLYQPPPASPAGMRALGHRLQRRFEKTRFPATATIAVNKACQCECAHCSAVFYNHSFQPDLSFPQMREALRQTVDLGVTTIILLGGEPLLRRDLCELIASVPKDQATVILFTNGEYLTPDKCEALAQAGLMGAFISLDSASPTRHDELRVRPGLFEKAMAGLQNLKAAGVLAGVSSYLSPERLAEGGFEEMMELGKQVDACEVTFFDAIPSGRWLKDSSCLLTPENRVRIRDLVRDYRARPGYPGISAQSTMTSECGSAFCFAANTQFYLTAWGEMCPCDFTPLGFGTFPEKSIRELWEGMISCEPYSQRAKSCRMQDTRFRERYINGLPDQGPFPYPFFNFS